MLLNLMKLEVSLKEYKTVNKDKSSGICQIQKILAYMCRYILLISVICDYITCEIVQPKKYLSRSLHLSILKCLSVRLRDSKSLVY